MHTTASACPRSQAVCRHGICLNPRKGLSRPMLTLWVHGLHPGAAREACRPTLPRLALLLPQAFIAGSGSGDLQHSAFPGGLNLTRIASRPQPSSPESCLNASASSAWLLPATTPKLSFVTTWHYLLKWTRQNIDSQSEVTEGTAPPSRGPRRHTAEPGYSKVWHYKTHT